MNTTLVLVFEIRQVNFTSEVRYEYHGSSGWISVTDGDPVYFEEWEYGTTYEFTIKFLCLTDNVTIRALSLFSEERYIHGTFQVTKDENRDVVTYATYQGEQINEGREPKYNYYGSTSDALYGDAALTVQLVEWAIQE